MHKKPALYLIPGTMCNALLWSKMLPALTDTFDVVYLSTPTGESLQSMVEHILIELPEQPVLLVGFSLGGYLASQLAMQYPQRVKKLFIIANSSGQLPASEIVQRDGAIRFVNQHGYGGMSRSKAASLIDDQHPNTNEIITIIRQMDKQLGKQVFLHQMHATTHRPDLYQGFLDVNIPTTFYYSQHDRLVDQDWIEHCTANNPQCDQIIQQGSGHMLPLEQPRALFEALIDWSKAK